MNTINNNDNNNSGRHHFMSPIIPYIWYEILVPMPRIDYYHHFPDQKTEVQGA